MNHQVVTNHEDWLAQADIYAVGALDGDELIAFEAHLTAGCPVCEEHLRRTREALTLLPQALEPLTPPPTLKTRLLAQIAAEADAAPSVIHPTRRRQWWMGLSALAAAGLLITLSVQLYQARQGIQQLRAQVASLQHTIAEREEAIQAGQRELQRATETIATLQSELAQREETIEAERHQREQVERVVASLQGELVEREAALRSLTGPQVRAVRLAGLPPSPSANGQVLWNPAARTGVLLTSGLPPTPPDRVYELWAIAGSEPVPAGIFRVDEAGHGFLRVPPLRGKKRVDKFAVTLEPAGGVPKPTGPMHLLGNL
jgi:hypothetical protein